MAPAGDKPTPKLLVCTGNDHQAVLDVRTLCELRAATGLQLQRVLSASRRKLADALELERRLHRPARLLQVTLPASAEGITFVDQVADGAWLCKRLAGVRVLLLSDYRGEEQGDWLGAVPHVVLLRTGIGAEEATVLVRKFWEGIGLEKEPAAALEEAIGCCAMEVRPLVKAVVHNAASAALRDKRFRPVGPAELDAINVEVSILTVPEQLAYAKLKTLAEGAALASKDLF
jgi:hypothetical protein